MEAHPEEDPNVSARLQVFNGSRIISKTLECGEVDATGGGALAGPSEVGAAGRKDL